MVNLRLAGCWARVSRPRPPPDRRSPCDLTRGHGFAPNLRAANEWMRGTVTIGWVSGILQLVSERESARVSRSIREVLIHWDCAMSSMWAVLAAVVVRDKPGNGDDPLRERGATMSSLRGGPINPIRGKATDCCAVYGITARPHGSEEGRNPSIVPTPTERGLVGRIMPDKHSAASLALCGNALRLRIGRI